MRQAKIASLNGVKDPMTWGAFIGAGALYVSDGDDRITDAFMQNDWIRVDNDELYRDLNGLITYATALLVRDNNWTKKAKRIAVEWSAFAGARASVDLLNATIEKETPAGDAYNAVGSHHALSPFAGCAMTRRNTAQLDIPLWSKYAIDGINYFLAASSAFGRVEQGGHSFADQLVSIGIGNFIGLFVHDLFMLEPQTSFRVGRKNGDYLLTVGYRY